MQKSAVHLITRKVLMPPMKRPRLRRRKPTLTALSVGSAVPAPAYEAEALGNAVANHREEKELCGSGARAAEDTGYRAKARCGAPEPKAPMCWDLRRAARRNIFLSVVITLTYSESLDDHD